MAGNENEALTSDPERQATQKPQLSRAKRFNRFLYNKEDKKICGRTWQSWLCLWCYYLGVWILFGALFTILIIGDYNARDKNAPQHTLYDFQPILQQPGMATIPQGDRKAHPVVINVMKFADNIRDINKFLEGYPNEVEIQQDCRKHDQPKECKMHKDEATLGPCSPDKDPNFGYDRESLEPCIILTVNKIFGWVPKTSTSNYTKNDLKIECVKWPRFEDTEYKGDLEEPVMIYPLTGFNGDCFPYCGHDQKSPRPFVMAKFKGLDSKERIGVMCVLTALNIRDSRKDSTKLSDQIGSIVFALDAKT